MISFLKIWSNQIIVAVIVATILEMLLPKGNNKKFVKMVIGLYVLIAIIEPVFSKISGKTIDINDFNYQKYWKDDSITTTSQNFENQNKELIQKSYQENIKTDIQNKLKQKGYEILSIQIEINENDGENYGKIEKLSLKLQKSDNVEDENDSNNLNVFIEEVNVQISNENIKKDTNKSNLSAKEKNEIVEYLSNEYSIKIKDIKIYE